MIYPRARIHPIPHQCPVHLPDRKNPLPEEIQRHVVQFPPRLRILVFRRVPPLFQQPVHRRHRPAAVSRRKVEKPQRHMAVRNIQFCIPSPRRSLENMPGRWVAKILQSLLRHRMPEWAFRCLHDHAPTLPVKTSIAAIRSTAAAVASASAWCGLGPCFLSPKAVCHTVRAHRCCQYFHGGRLPVKS